MFGFGVFTSTHSDSELQNLKSLQYFVKKYQKYYIIIRIFKRVIIYSEVKIWCWWQSFVGS